MTFERRLLERSYLNSPVRAHTRHGRADALSDHSFFFFFLSFALAGSRSRAAVALAQRCSGMRDILTFASSAACMT